MSSLADEVEQEEAEDRLRAGDYGGVAADDWHEGIEVERGTARHRLDLSHGFVRHIVHNQKAREAYEQQWQAENVDHPYNAPWSQEPEDRTARESWRSSDASRQDAPSVKPLYDAAAADRWAASEADQRSWWRRPTAAGSGYSMRSDALDSAAGGACGLILGKRADHAPLGRQEAQSLQLV
ncbi:hypothetical protein WJX72_003729 [[Myrmecia] bisecta]|uniref:Uncharacterized protein n=1 Tax=[Myrmecia] bisecta TaxID=41462 RepID=A0AAW1PFC2_9CHLO